jgi:predicted TIM-barrel fold metal-dependent hydrolase
MFKKVIDSHLHLDHARYGSVMEAAAELSRQLHAVDICKGVVLHLESQGWNYQEFSAAISRHDNLCAFVNISPHDTNAINYLEDAKYNYNFCGLKLHPRLQKLSLHDQRVIDLCVAAGRLDMPVLIDAFPDGDWLMSRFSVALFADLARACPDTKFIWAHFGGHHAIDFMMVAKRLVNVYLDISYSWLYYRGSSVIDDIYYALRSLKFKKVFYGSDYPDRSIADSLDLSLELFRNYEIDHDDLSRIMHANACDLFGWVDI